MTTYLAGIWKLRYFWLSLVKMDLRTRYRRSYLGIAWSLLHPIAMTAVICTVFHKLLGQPLAEFGPYVLTGLCFWSFLMTATTQGCQCLFQGEPYIRQHPAPIAIYPLRVVLGGGFHFLLALCVVLVLRWGLRGFDNLPALITLLPALALMFLFGWSVAILTGFANAYFPDTQHLSEVGLQILFYGTPIIYPEDMLRNKGVGWIVDYNPMAAFIHILRAPILKGEFPSLLSVSVVGVTVLIVSTLAALALVRNEKRIIFQL